MILRVSRKAKETTSVLLPPAPKHWLTPSRQWPPLCTTARYMYRHRHRPTHTLRSRTPCPSGICTHRCVLEDMKGPHPKAAQHSSCLSSLSFPSVCCSLSSLYLFASITVSFPPSKSSLFSPSRQNPSTPPSRHAFVLSVSLLQLSCLLSQSGCLKRYLSSLCTQSSYGWCLHTGRGKSRGSFIVCYRARESPLPTKLPSP